MTAPLDRLTTALADRYRVERKLGEGGMATVYLAEDLKHGRRVALKVLHPELAAVLGGDRFLAEIKTTAHLQHPNILQLFDSGSADGLLYYVMPFVEGETLRGRLTREKQLPVDDAIAIARGAAAALDYAHRHGVIHRDIKPENILLQDGQPLVADFGIALAVKAAGGVRLTQTGLSLGTPQYMSPEQATGERELDARSDVYALGAVTYEMLAGEPPFSGNTTQAIIAKLMTEEPRPLQVLRKAVPPHLEEAVHRALEKLPADRYASAAQFAEALGRGTAESLATRRAPTGASATATAPPALTRGQQLRRLVLARSTPWLLFLGAAVTAVWARLGPERSDRVYSFGVVIPESLSVRVDHTGSSLALSPDGSRLVYAARAGQGRRQLLVRELRELEPRALPGTEGAESPFFSPDGQWVAFFADGKLKKVAFSGGPPLTITDAPSGRGGTWGPQGTIVFTPGSGGALKTVLASGGVVRGLTRLLSDSGDTSHRFPDFLPDGKAAVFTIQRGGAYSVAVVSLADGVVRPLIEGAMGAHYVPTGHLLYASEGGALLAAPFDARRGRITGASVSLLEGILTKPTTGAAEYTVSPNGTLAYLGGASARSSLVLVDRQGKERVLTELRSPTSPRFSPDGRRIALTSFQGRAVGLQVYDVSLGTLSVLSFGGSARYPEWTPDGRRISFAWIPASGPDRQQDFYATAADGSGEPSPILRFPQPQWEMAWAPDGKSFAFRQTDSLTGRDLYVFALDSSTPQPFLKTSFDERSPAVSPDGRWLAYVSNESGHDEIYVRGYPAPLGRWQISSGGGNSPRWAPTGRELYYRSADSLISASVVTGPTFAVGARRALFAGPYFSQTDHAEYDVSPDNQHFVFIGGASAKPGLIITLNWFQELRRQTASAKAAP